MSVTSCICHPPGAHYLKLYEWQIEFCEGNQCAAALLSYFEYCHNWKLQQLQQAKAHNDALEKAGEGRTQEETLLQWHTAKELEAAILGLYRRDKIGLAIDKLVALDAIEVRKNPNPRMWHDHTKHFLFKPKTVNDWLKKRFPENRQSIVEKSEIPGENGDSPGIVEKSEIGSGKSLISYEKSEISNKEDVQRTQPKKTTMTPRAPAKADPPAAAAPSSSFSFVPVEEEDGPPARNELVVSSALVPVASVPSPTPAAGVPELGAEEQQIIVALDRVTDKYRLTDGQRNGLHQTILDKGLAYVIEKETLTDSKPRPNVAGFFLAALRDNYQPSKSTAPAARPKGEKPAEPEGWQDWLRREFGEHSPTIPDRFDALPDDLQRRIRRELAGIFTLPPREERTPAAAVPSKRAGLGLAAAAAAAIRAELEGSNATALETPQQFTEAAA